MLRCTSEITPPLAPTVTVATLPLAKFESSPTTRARTMRRSTCAVILPFPSQSKLSVVLVHRHPPHWALSRKTYPPAVALQSFMLKYKNFEGITRVQQRWQASHGCVCGGGHISGKRMPQRLLCRALWGGAPDQRESSSRGFVKSSPSVLTLLLYTVCASTLFGLPPH